MAFPYTTLYGHGLVATMLVQSKGQLVTLIICPELLQLKMIKVWEEETLVLEMK